MNYRRVYQDSSFPITEGNFYEFLKIYFGIQEKILAMPHARDSVPDQGLNPSHGSESPKSYSLDHQETS